MDELAQSLYEHAEKLETASAGTGVVFLTGLKTNALAKLNAGQPSAIISTTIDGETTTMQVDRTASQMFIAASNALRELEGDSVRSVSMTVDRIPL